MTTTMNKTAEAKWPILNTIGRFVFRALLPFYVLWPLNALIDIPYMPPFDVGSFFDVGVWLGMFCLYAMNWKGLVFRQRAK